MSAGADKLAEAGRAIAGTSLIGVRGATPADQDGIDATVAGLCAAGSWSADECARHQAVRP